MDENVESSCLRGNGNGNGEGQRDGDGFGNAKGNDDKGHAKREGQRNEKENGKGNRNEQIQSECTRKEVKKRVVLVHSDSLGPAISRPSVVRLPFTSASASCFKGLRFAGCL